MIIKKPIKCAIRFSYVSRPKKADSDTMIEPTSISTTKPNEWRSLPPMPGGRRSGGGIWVNDHQFLVLGGHFPNRNKQILASCIYYDTTTESWMNFPVDMPVPRRCFGLVLVGSRLFVMGGDISLRGISSDLISIDFSGDDLANVSGEWETLASMELQRHQFACVADSRYIYIFGGQFRKGGYLRSAERYDIETNEWTRLPDMPDRCCGCGAGAVGTKIYVVGGTMDARNSMATTNVFDTSSQSWEPASTVPDMKIGRRYLKVLVVDRFVVAIGGIDNRRVYSIEVLDTQRNVWMESPRPMKINRSGFMAAVSMERKEIIVAGGWTDKNHVLSAAEIISFEDGKFLAFCRFKERGQKVIGDTDMGEDELGVAIIAEALVESLLFLDLEPPFVLAILGRWGKGKSFFFNLMLEHMIKIQKKTADMFVRNTYAGHIYIVKFDAWTFSKGCVWSSFMYQILKSLNEQLQFEAKLEDGVLEDGGVSTIEVFRDLSKGEIEYLEGNKMVWKRYYNDSKNNGEFASERLLKAININYEDDAKELDRLEKIIQVKDVVDNLDGVLNSRGKNFFHEALNKVMKAEVGENKNEKSGRKDDVERGSFDPNYVDIDSGDDENGDPYDAKGSIDALIDKLQNISWLHYKFRVSKIRPFAVICAVALVILAVTLMIVIDDTALGAVTLLLSPAIPVVTSISGAATEVDTIISARGDLKTSKLFPEELEVSGVKDEDLIELNRKRLEIKNRTLALKGLSLRDTIAKKIDVEEYEKNLGIVHKVQQDLQLLSDGMLDPRQSDIFPRGTPRIVLFVDDLDRCEQDAVVEVIEALQLLVKTKLFVAVVAIDPRYVTLSVEKHYKGILDPRIPPSGMDFLEKIIQVPFRLPGVGRENVDSFIDSQIDIEPPQVAPTEKTESDAPTNPGSVETKDSTSAVLDPPREGRLPLALLHTISQQPEEQPDAQLDEDTVDDEDVEDDDFETGAIEIAEEEALPRHKVFFTKEEADMMKDIIKLFGVGPRCIRRIVNVFKILQIVWKRGSSRFEADHNLKRTTLFLMLMASDESTREVTYRIFDWMDSGRVKYHNVALDDGGVNDLASLFKRELKDWDKSFERSFNGETTKEGTLISFVENYLSEYKWTNFEDWSRISSELLLARCFSFYRIASDDTKPNQD